MKTIIILPAYNESIRVIKTLDNIKKNSSLSVIVVDDGSTDDTYFRLCKYIKNHKKIILLNHVINMGKGAAMKTGVEYALKEKADAVIFIDADGQHNPANLSVFEKLLNKYDMVFGYRELSEKMPFIRRFGNKIAIFIIGFLFKINRKDLLCGYLGFKTKVYKKIAWDSTRYGVETEIAVNLSKNKIRFAETKIDTIYIDKYKGVTMFDAFKILVKIPFWYFTK